MWTVSPQETNLLDIGHFVDSYLLFGLRNKNLETTFIGKNSGFGWEYVFYPN